MKTTMILFVQFIIAAASTLGCWIFALLLLITGVSLDLDNDQLTVNLPSVTGALLVGVLAYFATHAAAEVGDTWRDAKQDEETQVS